MQAPTRAELITYAIALAFVAVVHVLPWANGVCESHTWAPLMKANGPSCAEFWINRYQTSIQTTLSMIVGGVGLYFVLRQLRGLAEQNAITQQALDATRTAHNQVARIAIGQAVGALDDYARATSAMVQDTIFWMRGKKSFEAGRLRLIAEAQKRRAEIYAVLATREMLETWDKIDREFETMATHLAEVEEGGSIKDAGLISLTIRNPKPDSAMTALTRLTELFGLIFNLRDKIQDRGKSLTD